MAGNMGRMGLMYGVSFVKFKIALESCHQIGSKPHEFFNQIGMSKFAEESHELL